MEVAAGVADPELPMLNLGDLGIVREVSCIGSQVVVTITPTYSGCPAMQEISEDLLDALVEAGFSDVVVRSVLEPAWTSSWITEEGRRKLVDGGIAPPQSHSRIEDEPVPLRATARSNSYVDGPLRLRRSQYGPPCPLCGSTATELLSPFGSTACKALYRCQECMEPFEGIKEI
ncbi:MAG: phenylacetate-CoA oxygenase subunit PaaJ [Actinobacteria bacterium]|nr:phenylacetate-CoA oxygenase subunit PaaJ [Actinomycetota bacterium]